MKKILLLLVIGLNFCFSSSSLAQVWYPLPQEAYQFGKRYPEAQRLLYAFDYGHALVYERLLKNRGNITNPEQFENDLLKEIMLILKSPPNVKVEEQDIAPEYVYMFPLTLQLFDWSHMLHQFVFDILVTATDRGNAMDERVKQIYTQYQANSRIAITDRCKTMLFMDGHYFSKKFRETYPRFNLLIWSYHWFQIRLYEDLMAPTVAARDAGVKKTIKDFWDLIADLPDSADFDMMPEVKKVAPKFAARFPFLGPAFDNNHMLHDIVSDILVSSDKVPFSKIREEGVRTARMDLDPKAFEDITCPPLKP